MGLYGTIVLYPIGGRAPHPKRLDTVAREILRAFERCELLQHGTSEVVVADQELVIAGVEESHNHLTLVHLGVDNDFLRPALSELVFTMTQAEWSEGLDFPDFQSTEILALPLLDVTVLSRALRVVNFDGSVACRSWAMIEFSYEAIRIHEEVHCIRKEEHPLFRELNTVLQAEVDWTVVVG